MKNNALKIMKQKLDKINQTLRNCNEQYQTQKNLVSKHTKLLKKVQNSKSVLGQQKKDLTKKYQVLVLIKRAKQMKLRGQKLVVKANTHLDK